MVNHKWVFVVQLETEMSAAAEKFECESVGDLTQTVRNLARKSCIAYTQDGLRRKIVIFIGR